MNYYAILQVLPTASAKEIQKAYRQLVKQYHPDHLQQASPQKRRHSEEKLKQINIAYTILSNPLKRQQYDLRRCESGRTQTQTKRSASGTKASRATKKAAGRTPSMAAQRLARARRDYLNCKQAFQDMNVYILEWAITLGKTAVVTGLGTGAAAIFLLAIITGLLRLFQIPASGGTLLFLYLNLLVIQVSAVFVVMQRIHITVPRANRLKALTTVTGAVLFSFVLATAVTGFTFRLESTFYEPVLFVFIAHCLSCLGLGQEWIKPLLTQRRQLASKMNAARERMILLRNMA